MAAGAVLLKECVGPRKGQGGCPCIPGEESGARTREVVGLSFPTASFSQPA